MKRTNACGMLCLTVAMTALFGARPALAAEKVPSDRLLPPDVYAYATVPDTTELKARWNKTSLGQLGRDPELAEFWGELSVQWRQWSAVVELQTGLKLEELLDIPSGELSVAYVRTPGQKSTVVGFLDFGESEEAVKTLLDQAAETLEGQGARRSEREFEDTQIVQYTLPRDEADDEVERNGNAGQSFAYFMKGSRLVAGGDVAALEAVLTRWDGKHAQTFGDSEVYQYIAERGKTDGAAPLFHWYVNPLELLRDTIAGQAQANPQLQLVLGFLPALGVDRLRGIGGSGDMAVGDYDSVSRTFIYVDFPMTGLLNVFRFPATEQSPPQWVSADAASYFGLNWDVAGAYEAIETLFDTFRGRGEFAKLVDGMARGDQGPQVHLKDDIIDQLSGRIHVATETASPEPAGEDEEEADQYLVALGVKDADRMQAVLARVANAPGFPGTSREFGGETLYEFAVDGALGDTDVAMGLAVIQGHLMIAGDVATLEEVIEADPQRPSLADSPEYQKIARHFPEQTSILSFQQQDAQMRPLYDMLRSGEAAEFLPGLDFDTLPPFESIRKYLPPTGAYAAPDDRGALFVSFSLRGDDQE